MFVLLLCIAAPCDPLVFIDTNFANASPVDYEVTGGTNVAIFLRYDNERDSPNRAAGHWHMKLVGEPGATLRLTLHRFRNIWNGKPTLPISENTIAFTSEDGQTWTAQPTDFDREAATIAFDVTLPDSGELFIARLPPYRVSDLNALLDDIRDRPGVTISTIGESVQKRPLSLVRIGDEAAAFHVFLRGRAHPWEPGGSWVLDGLLRRLASDDQPHNFRVSVLPMANIDGVANGMTRFNINGKDLNRDWDAPADATLCPENAALEAWLLGELAAGRRIDLALEMHNDQRGRLHLGNTADADREAYLSRMDRFESLLREHTWFTEGRNPPSFRNTGSLSGGWLGRFGIDAVVHEFNADHIAGLDEPPSPEAWQLYGRQLVDVFDAYFE